MFKAVAFLARKDGVDRDGFIEHYETVHVPLIRRSFPQLRDYRRNYLDHTSRIGAPDAGGVDFDVVSAFYFDDRAGYEEMLAIHAGPAGEAIRADEQMFIDSTRTRMYVVEVRGH